MNRVPPPAGEATQRDRLEEQERLHNEFLAMLAHEIREPMTSCIGFADLLLQKGDRMTDSEQREALQTISRTGRRLVQLLEDILEISRMEGGGLTYVLKPVDLNRVVKNVLDEQRFLIERHHVRFAPATPAIAEADESRMHQVVANLVSNATKFSPDGTTIRIDTRTEDHEVILSVGDEGVGVDPEEAPRLFRRFARLTPSDALEHVPGTGLGLYIAKSIVDAHRGRIWIESDGARGSTFHVAIPVAPGPA